VSGGAAASPRSDAAGGGPKGSGPPPPDRPPFLLDFYPLEEASQTGLSKFFEALREGRFTTTQCPRDGRITWPPRSVCPTCHKEGLDWIDLPKTATIYAFSAVLAGAPLGMEADVPFAVGLVDLDGVPLRLFGRIAGRPWDRLAIGGKVEVEPFDLPDGRIFYRFRAL
jgi:uncharacterized OB-fold protein